MAKAKTTKKTPLRQIRTVNLGDLHWGAVPPDRLENEFNSIVMPWLRDNQFEALIQEGDWFDKRLSLDSEDAKAAMRCVVQLCQLCQQRGVPFRIIKGTLSHDYFQLQNYHALETEYSCFRIIGTAQHEELLPGFDVLWMPEEYPTDYSDFYSQFFFDEDGNSLVYDAIFGHGEIDVAANWSSMNEGERHYGGTPCHEGEFLLAHCSGPIWFGHVHNRFRHKQRLGYPGSFTRWCHGEEDPKGFDVLDLIDYGDDHWTVRAGVVENTLAPEYRTVLATEILDMTDAPDAIVQKIRAEVGAAFKLRVKMADFPIGVEELSVVRGALVNDRAVELVSAARAINETPTAANEEVGETAEASAERQDRLSYLRDPNLPGESRLLRYLHEKFPDRQDVTLEDVRELTAPLVG
jgi:hypothetical protein